MQDNIIFGAQYDEERYNKGSLPLSTRFDFFYFFLTFLSVIYQCGLQRDLSLFDAGDKTEVGEKGLTLRSCNTCSTSRNSLLIFLVSQRWSEGPRHPRSCRLFLSRDSHFG
jgi:hypothetical protein